MKAGQHHKYVIAKTNSGPVLVCTGHNPCSVIYNSAHFLENDKRVICFFSDALREN